VQAGKYSYIFQNIIIHNIKDQLRYHVKVNFCKEVYHFFIDLLTL